MSGDADFPFADRPPSPYTKATLDEVELYLRSIAGSLGLAHWRIYVSTHEAAEGARAETFFLNAAPEMVVALGPHFDDRSELRRRAVLIHELLHGSVRRMVVATWPMADALGREARRIAEADFDEAHEQSVDTLAAALAPFFPESPPIERNETIDKGGEQA